MINQYSILKYFSLDELQNYLVFNKLDVFVGLVKLVTMIKLNRGNLQECQKKVLKTHILQTLVLLQKLIDVHQFRNVQFKGI